MTVYNELIEKLDAFIRKFYVNRLLRGLLLLSISVAVFALAVGTGEYFLYFPVWFKITAASIFVAGTFAALLFLVIVPLLQMSRIGKRISHEQAAEIVGKHFPEVSDRLINILQLRAGQQAGGASSDFIDAAIAQKADRLVVVPFKAAVDLRRNKKFLPWLLPPVLIGAIVAIAAPDAFRSSAARLLQPGKEFVKPAPFAYTLKPQPLQVLRNDDFDLQVSLSGKAIPEKVYLQTEGEEIPLNAVGKDQYSYQFKNCTKDITFRFAAGGFISEKYVLRVLPKPMLTHIKLQLNYPAYTGRKSELRTALSDLNVPVGTNISWTLGTDAADAVSMRTDSTAPVLLQRDGENFLFQAKPMQSATYELTLMNREAGTRQSLSYKINVVPDEFPSVQLQQFKDSSGGTQVVLSGNAGDDYGIAALTFKYEVTDKAGKLLRSKSVRLPGAGVVANFRHYFDVNTAGLQSGEQLNYFIEVCDNDGVHGSKCTRSEIMSYRAPSAQQIDSAIVKNAEQINQSLSSGALQNKQLQSEMKSVQSKMMQNQSSEWQQRQAFQEVAKMQQAMRENLEQIKKRLDEQKRQTEQRNMSEDLREKQEAVSKQLDQVLNKELNEQMKKLQELMNKLNRDDQMQQLQQMQEENKLFSMDMERMQSLMKQLEMQIKLEDAAAKAAELAAKQADLQKQNAAGDKDNKQLAEQQKKLEQQLQQLMNKELRDMKEMNKDMQQQQNFNQEQQQGDAAQKEMQESEQELNKNENKKASESQSKAQENLEEMAASLRKKAAGMDAEEIEMNIRAVRQILTNLMRLSFDQEKLMNAVRTTPANQPAYLANMEKQNELRGNARIVKDSLFSLSKKLFTLSAAVNKETGLLERNLQSSVDALESRKTSLATARQQAVMMHTNNLALMLNEVLSNLMQEQSQSKKSGNQGSCKKPGGKTPKPGAGKQLSDIISKQKGLGQKMQDAAGQPKQGQNGKQPQGQSGSGQGNNNGGNDGNARELMRMAQEQAAVRRQLAELNSMLKSGGNTALSKELQQLQNEMDKNETDLVNRKLDGELLKRQQEILSRMLETETSLREQEQDEKRTSKAPENVPRPVPGELKQYLNAPLNQAEPYRTVPPALKPYYKSLNEQYFRSLK